MISFNQWKDKIFQETYHPEYILMYKVAKSVGVDYHSLDVIYHSIEDQQQKQVLEKIFTASIKGGLGNPRQHVAMPAETNSISTLIFKVANIINVDYDEVVEIYNNIKDYEAAKVLEKVFVAVVKGNFTFPRQQRPIINPPPHYED